MKFEPAGKDFDYKSEIKGSYDLLRGPFSVLSSDFLLPCNPVSTCATQPARIAFFGLNAYCDDSSTDFADAQLQRNFIEWCQGSYNPKLFTVMGLWTDGLPSRYMSGGSLYYTNFVKLVLRQSLFKYAVDVERALKASPSCIEYFESLARKELIQLKGGGCETFVCFGTVVFRLMMRVAADTNTQLIHERHFSRYIGNNSDRLIRERAAKL